MESEENMDTEKMENEEKMEGSMPEAERTPEGKWKCRKDSMEYDNKDDYEAHCKETHME